MSVVVITGCSSGFWMLAALEFARRGDSVYTTMSNTAKGDRLHGRAEVGAATVEVRQLDVNDISSVGAAIEEVIGREGLSDVVVNNAGISLGAGVEDFDDDEVL